MHLAVSLYVVFLAFAARYSAEEVVVWWNVRANRYRLVVAAIDDGRDDDDDYYYYDDDGDDGQIHFVH
jgi:hypothetical protein